MMLTPSEHARYARAELETIVASLRLHELAQLVALGRRLLDESEEDQSRAFANIRAENYATGSDIEGPGTP